MSDKTNLDFSAILSKLRKEPEKNNRNPIIPLCFIALLSLFWIPVNPVTLYQDYPEFRTHAITLSAFHGAIYILAVIFYFFSSTKNRLYRSYSVFACIAICLFNGYFWWNDVMIAPEEKGKIFIYNQRFVDPILHSDDQKYTYDIFISGENFFAPAIKRGDKIIKISDITSTISNKFLITNDDGSKWEALYRLEIDKDAISKLLTLGIIYEEDMIKAIGVTRVYIELAIIRHLKDLYESAQCKDGHGKTFTEALTIFEELNKPPEPPSLAKIIESRESEIQKLKEDYANFLTSDMINKIERLHKDSCQKEYKKKLKKWELEKSNFLKDYAVRKESFIKDWEKNERNLSQKTIDLQETYKVGYITYNLKLDKKFSAIPEDKFIHINLFRVESK